MSGDGGGLVVGVHEIESAFLARHGTTLSCWHEGGWHGGDS